MIQNRLPKGGLLLAGLAAFAYYKYSKLSPEDKRNLAGTIKEKGKKLYDQYVPDELKKVFGSKDTGSYGTDSFINESQTRVEL